MKYKSERDDDCVTDVFTLFNVTVYINNGRHKTIVYTPALQFSSK